MKTIITQLNRLMTAITFAEANEPELAREFSACPTPARNTPPQANQMPDGAVLTNQAAL